MAVCRDYRFTHSEIYPKSAPVARMFVVPVEPGDGKITLIVSSSTFGAVTVESSFEHNNTF